MSGAFDRLGPHRAALMNSLGDALKAADQHAKAEAIGQADMFGVLAEEPEQIEQSYASCQPWPEQVVLDGERETLGLYLTDLDLLSEEELLNRRYQRLMSYGYA